MRRFLLCTNPSAMPPDEARRVWRVLGNAAAPAECFRDANVVIFAGAQDAGRWHDDATGFCFLPAQLPVSWRTRRTVAPAELLASVRERGVAALGDLLAPYAAIVRTGSDAPVLVATDAWGLQHVYGSNHDRAVFVSDSCLLVAAATGSALDADAVTTFLRIGHYLGADSPFRGVEKLRGGFAWQVAGADRTAAAVPAADVPVLPPTECLRACAATQLEARPDAAVELSGGLDSRLIVAALGPDACRGRAAVTLGTADAPDVHIAGQLARELGFDWQFVDLAGLTTLPDAEILPLVERASLRCDHAAQPLARAVLEWVNARVPPRPRFSGQNGEIARGFFHPGFRDSAAITGSQVERLLHWRMTSNESIDRELVAAEHWRRHERDLVQRLLDLLRGTGRSWLAATDALYLGERMQRWVGAAYSAEVQDHAILAPFFDPRFVTWAETLAPEDERDSRAMARLCAALSPALAAIPTAGGLSPQALGSSSLLARGRRRARFAGKVVRKLAQRLRGTRRSPVGAPEFARRLLANGIDGPDAFPHVARLDWIRADAIGPVLARGTASWASLGHLLALEWMLAALAAAAPLRRT